MKLTSVLIVEDDKLFSIELRNVLSRLGYRVIRTVPADSREALKVVNKEHPDMILIDIHLEKQLAGLTLAEKLKEKGIPYLLMTIDDSAEVFDEAKRLAPHSYLVKPFGKKRLDRNIQLVLKHFEQKVKLEEGIYYARDRNGEPIQIQLSQIEVIEAIGNYIYLHIGGQRYSLRRSLTSFKSKLPKQDFLQIHRRYIVAVSHVELLNEDAGAITVAGQKLQIGGKFKSVVVDKLKKL